MKYIVLGNSDLEVSRIALGCMSFGDPNQGMHRWTLNQEETTKIISQALDLGINFFDTALAYQNGTSEQYLARALKTLTTRDKVVLATKFLARTPEQIQQGISIKDHILASVHQSLENLDTDYIDLYIYHTWDKEADLREVMETLDSLVKTKKVRYLGISNCFAYQLAKANAIAERYGYTKFISMQGHYNLLFREEEREMNPLCKEDNIALTPYSSLASGRLTRLPTETSKRLELDAFAKLKYDRTADIDEAIILRVAQLAQKHHVSMTVISLAWLLSKVSAPIVGATKPHHLEGMVEAVEFELSEADISYLEELYIAHDLVGIMAK